jgi:hypothetical protein
MLTGRERAGSSARWFEGPARHPDLYQARIAHLHIDEQARALTPEGAALLSTG